MGELVDIGNKSFRNGIVELEDVIKSSDGAFVGDSEVCPLKHSFADGIYVREIFIPAGIVLAGKIHKHEHPNFLMSGEVEVITEFGGKETLVGPLSMISKAGTKRIVCTKTDTVWITVHCNPTNTQDLTKLENEIIADSYNDFERYIESKNSTWNKIGGFIKKRLGWTI